MAFWTGQGRSRRVTGRSVAAALLTASVGMALAAHSPPARAHHAFAAEYDGDQPFDLTGTVAKVRWINPHSWLYFDVVEKDGTVTHWSVEFGSPNALAEAGLLRADVASGSKVRIQGFRAKNGLPSGYSVNLILPDGRTFKTGGAPGGPAFNAASNGVASAKSATADAR